VDSKARNLQLFAWSVTTLGMLWLLLRLPQLALPWWLMLTFLAAEVGAQWFSVAIPGGIRISLDFVVVFFVFLSYGPVPASLAIFISCISTRSGSGNPGTVCFFIAAQFIVATYAMAAVFDALGGQRGADIIAWANLLPLVLAVARLRGGQRPAGRGLPRAEGRHDLEEHRRFPVGRRQDQLRAGAVLGAGVYLFFNLGVQGIALMIVLAVAFGWPLLVLLRRHGGRAEGGLDGKITAIGTIIVAARCC